MRSLLAGCLLLIYISPAQAGELSVIVFGSCLRQDKPQPIWEVVLAQKPDLFIFTGDNIYADTHDMAVMKAKYDQLGAQPGFQRLRETCPVVATWDDHDYGMNDAGADYPKKEESKRAFLEFFREPADSARWMQSGVYAAQTFGPPERAVQIILLDTRTFRSPLKRSGKKRAPWIGPYQPAEDPAKTLLGEAQWAWLAERLKEPARLRLLVSSIQVLPLDHSWEKWGNLPRERDRLLDLLRRTQAQPVVILSGDRHLAELSQLPGEPWLYEVTSSAMNTSIGGHKGERNRYRLGQMVRRQNVGVLEVHWLGSSPQVTLRILDAQGRERLRWELGTVPAER